jgi:hypothetical protein
MENPTRNEESTFTPIQLHRKNLLNLLKTTAGTHLTPRHSSYNASKTEKFGIKNRRTTSGRESSIYQVVEFLLPFTTCIHTQITC